jgi:hypothetical protein
MPNLNRKDMPQIDTQNLSKAVDMVSDKVRITKGKIAVGKLKKSQKELYKDKIEGIAARFTSPDKFKPLIISKDNHIVDGHHRWGAAIHKWGTDVKIPIIRIDLPIMKAIALYKDVADSLNEAITIPIEIGDTILGGKFKNKRIVVKSIDKNEKGDITINGKPLMKFRLVNEQIGYGIGCKNCNHSWDIEPNDDRPYLCHNCGYDSQMQKIDMVGFKDWKNSLNEGTINEMPMDTLKDIDRVADKFLNPVDVVLTNQHFFDRLNDPRNGKEISGAELVGFFKRLGKKKKQFVDFLNQYNQIVAVDDRTKLNIPFMKQANKAIAKTIMRKDDFKTTNQKLDI